MKPQHYALCDLKRNIGIEVKLWNILFHFQNSDVVGHYQKFMMALLQENNKHLDRRCLTGSYRSGPPELSLGKGFRRTCSKFTGEHPCRSVISIKLQSNFIEITLWHGCSK